MFTFDNVKYKDILAIDDLKIELGKVTCITGPSGSGKSTFLRLINKLISPDSGIIALNGENIASINSVSYRRRVPMLSQSPVTFPGTIRDNLLIGRKFQGKKLLAMINC
ncbi:ATP-binding cassette domain-containing protein [Anaerococcus cruorum]|uniref:ATP-binding cassette domain-containing protein n=1 Tax=Anaerococcus sp. WGS1596 TaxID=3366806 RepID=UPI00372D68EB